MNQDRSYGSNIAGQAISDGAAMGQVPVASSLCHMAARVMWMQYSKVLICWCGYVHIGVRTHRADDAENAAAELHSVRDEQVISCSQARVYRWHCPPSSVRLQDGAAWYTTSKFAALCRAQEPPDGTAAGRRKDEQTSRWIGVMNLSMSTSTSEPLSEPARRRLAALLAEDSAVTTVD